MSESISYQNAESQTKEKKNAYTEKKINTLFQRDAETKKMADGSNNNNRRKIKWSSIYKCNHFNI